MSNSINVFDTGHINASVHSAQIWSEFVESEGTFGHSFDRKFRAYDKRHGHDHVQAAEQPRFIKERLNFRKHDLPHAHNPVTDFFVPSFTGFPLPERGPDDNDMTGAPRAYGHGATHPGASALNPRHSRDVPHGEYFSVDVNATGHRVDAEPPSGRQHRDSACSERSASVPGPALYPTRYTKKGGTMNWRSYVNRSGKNNKNLNMVSTYGHTFTDPWNRRARRPTGMTLRPISQTF